MTKDRIEMRRCHSSDRRFAAIPDLSNMNQRRRYMLRAALIIFATVAALQTAHAQVRMDSDIDKCGTVIDTPGVYSVTHELKSTSTTEDCIQISSPGVRLALDGFNLSGPGGNDVTSAGMRILKDADGIQVLLGGSTIEGFGVGILDEASGVSLQGGSASFTIRRNAAQGILVRNASGVTIEAANSIENGAAGVELAGASGVIVQDFCILQSNGRYGLWVRSSSGNQFFNLETFGNTLAGIYVGESADDGQTVPERDESAPRAGAPATDSSDNNVFVDMATIQNSGYGVVIGKGDIHNVVAASEGNSNTDKDAVDENGDCDHNQWVDDKFITKSPACIP